MEPITRFFSTPLFQMSGTHVTPASLLVFVMTIAFAAALGRLAKRGVRRLLVRRDGAVQEGLAYALGKITQYIVMTVGMLVALENFGFSVKSVAALGAVLMVGIGFGLQNIAQNFISGIILLIERPVCKGDFINVGETAGTVEDIAMRATRIVTRDGVLIIVPNSELISGRVINRSAPTTTARVRVTVGVAYGSDTNEVRKVLLEVAQADRNVLKNPAPEVFFRNFGDSALEFQLAVWVNEPQHEQNITSDLRFAVDDAFRKVGIVIPFPQRELHLKNGWEAPTARSQFRP